MPPPEGVGAWPEAPFAGAWRFCRSRAALGAWVLGEVRRGALSIAVAISARSLASLLVRWWVPFVLSLE